MIGEWKFTSKTPHNTSKCIKTPQRTVVKSVPPRNTFQTIFFSNNYYFFLIKLFFRRNFSTCSSSERYLTGITLRRICKLCFRTWLTRGKLTDVRHASALEWCKRSRLYQAGILKKNIFLCSFSLSGHFLLKRIHFKNDKSEIIDEIHLFKLELSFDISKGKCRHLDNNLRYLTARNKHVFPSAANIAIWRVGERLAWDFETLCGRIRGELLFLYQMKGKHSKLTSL